MDAELLKQILRALERLEPLEAKLADHQSALRGHKLVLDAIGKLLFAINLRLLQTHSQIDLIKLALMSPQHHKWINEIAKSADETEKQMEGYMAHWDEFVQTIQKLEG